MLPMFQIPTHTEADIFIFHSKYFDKYSSEVRKYSFVIGALRGGTHYFQAY